MDSQQEYSQPPEQAPDAQQLAARFAWLCPASTISAAVTSLSLVYQVFKETGFAVAFFAVVLVSIFYRFGPAPIFAIASSILCFYFHSVDIWLPILAYIVAGISFLVTMRINQAQKAVQGY